MSDCHMVAGRGDHISQIEGLILLYPRIWSLVKILRIYHKIYNQLTILPVFSELNLILLFYN